VKVLCRVPLGRLDLFPHSVRLRSVPWMSAPAGMKKPGQKPLLAGIALAEFEITHAEALRHFVLFGALVIVAAAGLWLIDEFIWPVWRH
jgi:hypothetical protein